MQPEIYKFDSQDYEEILTVWEQSVRATHFFLTEEEILFYRPLVLKYALPDTNLFGIRSAAGKICGFIGLRNQKVEMLFISPKYIGQGLGKKLLLFAVKEKNCNKIDVNEENPKALEFYLHCGFKILSRDELDERGKPHPIIHLGL